MRFLKKRDRGAFVKKIILILLAVVTFAIAFSQERWEVYTNTSHVYSSDYANGKIRLATWGGIEEYKIVKSNGDISLELVDTYSSINGLISNEIVDLKIKDNDVWAGSYNNGISIIVGEDIFNLNDSNGLLSNAISDIEYADELFYVASDNGLTSYFKLDGISFPIPNKNYTVATTQGALIDNDIIEIEISNNILIITTAAGINWVSLDTIDDNSSWNSISVGDLDLEDAIMHMAMNNSVVALSTNQELVVIKDFPANTDIEKHSIKSTYDSEVLSLSVSASGEVFFSLGIWDSSTTFITDITENRLYKIDANDNITSYLSEQTELYNLNTNQMDYILEDRVGIKDININDDITILSTWGDGIIFNYEGEWYYYSSNGIGFNAVADMAVDNQNKLWVCCGYYGTNQLRKGARGISSFDGTNWETYNIRNSPLHSDNINSITVGHDDKVWFGAWYASPSHELGWKSGLASLDQDNDEWALYNMQGAFEYNHDSQDYSDVIPSVNPLNSATIAGLATDNKGNIMVAEQSHGIEILNPEGTEVISSFSFNNAISNYARLAYNSTFGYFFTKAVSVAGDKAELYFWESQELPSTNGSHWTTIPMLELRESKVYDFAEVTTPYETQLWIASSAGLFMYNGDDWYKYDTVIKRYKWSSGWQVDTRYFVGENKLFGAMQTIPKALETDGYGCIWIGTEDTGLTKYDTNTENFSNYSMTDYPLVSNSISDLAYEPLAGKLYIGSTDGLCSVTVGATKNNTKKFSKISVYPNPFYPDKGDVLKIINEPTYVMPSATDICKIYDLSGQLVYELPVNKYQSFTWDGNNANGKKCSSGIYFYVISDNSGETNRGKIALIRGE
jgi:hypothetical protein